MQFMLNSNDGNRNPPETSTCVSSGHEQKLITQLDILSFRKLVATFPFPTCPPGPPDNVPGTDQAIQARLVENQLTTQGANLRQFDLKDSYLSVYPPGN